MYKLFLPFIHKSKVRLGTHVVNPNATRMQYAVDGQSACWIIEHDKVELSPGVFDWDRYDKQLYHLGTIPQWLQVKYVPKWMRSIEDLRCSAPKREYWEHFALFVISVIARYKPFAVEIWNEPEVPPENLDAMDELSGVLGCWEDGGYFGEFIKYVYQVVKLAHPKVTFMGGALMLGNDYHFKFAEKMIKEGDFDVLSFHAYPGFGLKNYSVPLQNADRLKDIYKLLGKKLKPFWLSETSYRVYDLYDGFLDEQAEYLRHVYKYAQRHNIWSIYWYTLAENRWCNTDLVQNGVLRPSYYVFKELLGAS